jgi:hypothetical protein
MNKSEKHRVWPFSRALNECGVPAVFSILLGLSLLVPVPSLRNLFGEEKKLELEESRFDIYVDEKQIGYEEFSVRTSADSIESKSVVNFRDPGKSRKKVQMETELTMDSHCLPRAYLLRTDVEGQKGTVTGTFTPGEANFEYKGSGNPMKRGLLVGSRYVILDTNIFHHFIFVARLFDMGAGDTQTIEAVIPQELESGKLKVNEIGVEVVPIRGKKMTLHHLRADSGMLYIDLWVDDQKILYKIAMPTKKIEVIRRS